MEPTTTQIEAATEALLKIWPTDLSHLSRKIIAEVAVCAAFAVVPDPVELANVWETDETETWFQPEASEYAESLRAFMRGDDK